MTLLTGRRNWAKPSKKLVHKVVWALCRCDGNNNGDEATQGSFDGEERARGGGVGGGGGQQQGGGRQQQQQERDENLNLAMMEKSGDAETSDHHDQVTKF